MNAPAPTSAAARRFHLVYMEVAAEVGSAARQVVWEAVGTHWVLYAITGNEQPQGRTTSLYRSEAKAVERGRTAVDEGALADEGAIAAVVNSAREVLWACWVKDAIRGPEETELPENLRSVPAPETPEHADWQWRWEQFVATRP
ncbi:hypothetical protein ACFV0D_21905 [Streptomyces sp. NPDC059556]|uniref:hypothetical protein n=1 Tax=Streptomyces sp. NPDC059556 TaxID=3346863 RepID=UPI0036C170AE